MAETTVKADHLSIEAIEGSDTKVPMTPELAIGHFSLVAPFQQGIQIHEISDEWRQSTFFPFMLLCLM